MKKHLIAAAVAAAVAAPAMAQSTVEVYGILSTAYSATDAKLSVDGVSSTVKSTNSGQQGAQAGNRLGFRGTEDLGGGMKAGFVYELGANLETGLAANRLGYAQLQGGFGTVRAGRVDSLTRSVYNSFTAFGNSGFAPGNFGASLPQLVAPAIVEGAFQNTRNGTAISVGRALDRGCGAYGYSIGAEANASVAAGFNSDVATASANCTALADAFGYGATRVNGSIGYISPSFSGVTVQAQFGKLERDSDANASTNDQTSMNFGINYAAGPLALAVALDTVDTKANERNGAAATAPALITTLLNRTNELQADTTMFAGSYDFGVAKVFGLIVEKELKFTDGDDSLKIRENTIGVQVPVGALQLVGSYSDGSVKAADRKDDLSGYQLQANYRLSKRTHLFAMYGETEWKGDGLKSEIDGFALGVQHSF